MKRIFFFMTLGSIFLCSQPLEAFREFIVMCQKRTKDIPKVLIERLNSSGRNWEEAHEIDFGEYYVGFAFFPKTGDPEYLDNWNLDYCLTPQELFYYKEYSYKGNREDINTLDKFAKKVLLNQDSELHKTEEKIISQSKDELKYEAILHPISKQIKMGVLDGPVQTKTLTPASKQVLIKVVQTGNKQFALYGYEAKNRMLSNEEKEYWFKMFDYSRINF